jgi:hypothetical protein
MTDDELDAKLFDYHEGKLSPEERAELERVMMERGEPLTPQPDEDEKLKSGLHALKAAPSVATPDNFTANVTETIHRRSAGRFFARRTFGDRIPFGIVLIVALVIALGIAAVLWTSSTGSLKVRRDKPAPTAPP